MKIMFIEDEDFIREYFLTMFADKHEIVTYNTIEDAERHLKINGPSIDGIVTDDNVLDGSIVANFDRIRKNCECPIVLVSGNDFQKSKLYEMGFADFISKPAGRVQYEKAVEIIAQNADESEPLFV